MKSTIKILKRFSLKLLQKLPSSWFDFLVRLFFAVDLPSGRLREVQYKVAQTQDEVEQALKLIQDSYVESKLTHKSSEEIRINKYKLLPTTTIFIAKYKDEVVATASQVMDTGLGLPIESFISLENQRKTGRRISEITGLAVKKAWRSQSTGIFFPLISYSVLYCRRIIGTQDVVIVTRASVQKFYRAIFGFKPLSLKATAHTGVNNHLSFAQILDLDKLEENFKSLYGLRRPTHKNVYKIFKNFPWESQCDFKKEKYDFLCNHSFTLKTMKYFFSEKSRVLETLSLEDRKVLHNLYHNEIYQGLISLENISYHKRRKHPRFYVNMNINNQMNSTQKVFQISKGGFSVQGDTNEDILEGYIQLNDKTHCRVKAQKVWDSPHVAGYKIIDIDHSKWDGLLSWVSEKTNSKLEVDELQVA